jgi:hypothetical protein
MKKEISCIPYPSDVLMNGNMLCDIIVGDWYRHNNGRFRKIRHGKPSFSVSPAPASLSRNDHKPSNDLICLVSLSVGYKSAWVATN